MSEREPWNDAWVCQDCYFAHHYGFRKVREELDPPIHFDGSDLLTVTVDLWYAGEDDEPVGGWHEIRYNHSLAHNREPLWALEGFELADNTCSNHNGDDETECSECGHDGYEDGIEEFSWSACDGCHSHLGGSRYRLSLWKREEVSDGSPAKHP